MIKTYIVSLASEQKRRAHMQSLCSQYGIEDAKFIDAVDMRKSSIDEVKESSTLPIHKKARKQRQLSPGEVGCALSHHHIYKEMVDKQINYAFVLEDDAQFIRDPLPLLNEQNLALIAEQCPFDVLILGYVKTLETQLPYYYRRVPIKYKAKLALPEGDISFGTPWKQYGCGTVAYIITLEGAKKLLEVTSKPCVAADDWLYFETYFNLRVIHSRPAFVLEDLLNFESSIRIEKKNFLKPKLSSVVIRSIKGYIKNFAMNRLGMK